ncbi:hypothetical protein [Flavobacterium aestivum]|uniref:hypothetical protein n=1 Tax=Flavobacterium aestivum TaxID=3003257 RepID=UPI002285B3BB|nr:hypothetical protein [Flavobacterium aestivum]
MNELELLEELIQNEHNLKMSMFYVHFANNEDEKQIANNNRNKIQDKIDLLKIELRDIEDKTQSQKAKFGIINQLNHYVEQINLVRPGLKLTRKQDMLLENMLFSYISMDIYRQISEKVIGSHIPAYLHYTDNEKDSIEIPELTEFLKNEISIVKSIENVDYIKLQDYYQGFRQRMVDKFMN